MPQLTPQEMEEAKRDIEEYDKMKCSFETCDNEAKLNIVDKETQREVKICNECYDFLFVVKTDNKKIVNKFDLLDDDYLYELERDDKAIKEMENL